MNDTKANAPKIHAVIRCFNEEDWIRSCLTTLLRQDYPNLVITVVDSGSQDASTRIVQEFTRVNIVCTSDYKPGKAIMDGVRSGPQDADYLFLVSAHCLLIGRNVLTNYVQLMQAHHDLAAAYGRQLPLHYTSPDDTRDLLNTFGEEFRIQSIDTFFHNANSFIRMNALRQFPIDEKIKHIEDRVWAKHVISAGWKIAYLPTAAVYHYHGLNQHGNDKSFRADGVAGLLRRLQLSGMEQKYEKIHCRKYLAPVVLLGRRPCQPDPTSAKQLPSLVKDLDSSQPCFLLCDETFNIPAWGFENIKLIYRNDLGISDRDSFRSLSRTLLAHIESQLGMVVDALSFIDLSYEEIKLDYLNLARTSLFENGRSGVVPAWEDYGNFWIKSEEKFIALDVNFNEKGEKSAIYRSALGQGGCIRASAIRGESEQLHIDEFITTSNVELLRRVRLD